MPWAQQLAEAEARRRTSESVSGLLEVAVGRLVVARMFGCLASGSREDSNLVPAVDQHTRVQEV
jgi:hypothetical protein